MAAVAVAAASFALSPAVSAAAETDLGAIGFGAVVVDSAHEHVLVSGPTANVVDVLSFSGELLATIPHVYGAEGMVVDKNKLYVIESTTGSVVQINLKTLELKSKPLARGLVRPQWIALAGKSLWVSTAVGTEQSELVSVNPTTHGVMEFPESSYTDPDFATSPGDPDTLFLAVDGDSPGSVYRFDVSSGAPVIAASNTFTNQGNIRDLAVSPDGTRMIPAAGAPYDFEELSATTLMPDGLIYPGEAYPSAVAVSGSPADLLATGIAQTSGMDIRVDPLGRPEAIFEASTHSSSSVQSVAPHGLAMSASGQSLFAVSFTAGDDAETVLNTYQLP